MTFIGVDADPWVPDSQRRPTGERPSRITALTSADHKRIGSINLSWCHPRVITADDAAYAHIFASHSALALQVSFNDAHLQVAVDTRKVIGAAQGILMERYRLNMAQALQTLRSYRAIRICSGGFGYCRRMPASRLIDVPTAGAVDDTFAFFRSGYTYISQRCDALGVDAFKTRLLGKPVVCARGEAAAASFYGGDAFTRTAAMPKSAQHLLQDEGSVQDLDGSEHRARKSLFLPMLEPSSVMSFTRILREIWKRRSARWDSAERLVLFSELNSLLTEAALRWSGLTTDDRTIANRRRELTAMIDKAGAVGPMNWLSRLLRRRAESWAARTITGIRLGVVPATSAGMARAIAEHREDGRVLPPSIAAVELLNVLRPIVAVGRFATFAALALATFPGWRESFESASDAQLRRFVHEVRRYYPFFPVIGGRARADVSLAGYELPAGTWVILDLYGTNHDERLWPSPYEFRPERFDDGAPGPFDLIPQGGGDYANGHRCPGEHVTIAAMCELVRLLCQEDYVLPAQDLTYALSDMPTLPRSGVVLQRRPA